jgi:hypothetical protein
MKGKTFAAAERSFHSMFIDLNFLHELVLCTTAGVFLTPDQTPTEPTFHYEQIL